MYPFYFKGNSSTNFDAQNLSGEHLNFHSPSSDTLPYNSPLSGDCSLQGSIRTFTPGKRAGSCYPEENAEPEIIIPRKLHISEEIISNRFSIMDISGSQSPITIEDPELCNGVSASYSSAFQSSLIDAVHDVEKSPSQNSLIDTGNSDSELSERSKCRNIEASSSNDLEFLNDLGEQKLHIPDELREDYNRLRTTGGLNDKIIQSLLYPKPCLSLVPYTPRLPHLQILPQNEIEKTKNNFEEMEVSLTPVETSPTSINFPAFIPSTAESRDQSFQFSLTPPNFGLLWTPIIPR